MLRGTRLHPLWPLLACLLVLRCACAASASGPHELTRSDLEAWLDGYLPYALQKADIAGAVVLVIEDGAILLQKGYGEADIARKIPMDPERTLVGVGSVSKTFTWTAVMQLVEQHRLDLDRDVNTYLDFKIPEAFGEPITLRNLMTHTAGFEERLKQYVRADQPSHSLSEYMKLAPVPARIYPPGAVQAYSNYGTQLAGYIVERVSGEPFADYIARHILRPLDMQHSTFVRPVPERLRANLAMNYDVASSGVPLPAHANTNDVAADPAGDLLSTAADMSHFMLAHLQGGQYEGHVLLSSETARLMHTPVFTPFPHAHGTALGFFRGDYNGHRILMHDGDLSGFHTDMQLLPDEGIGFFFCINSDGKGGLIGASYSLRASLFPRFMDRYFPAPAQPPQPTVASAREHAQLAAGEYRMSRRPSGDFMEALYLALGLRIVAKPDGTIETPALLNFAGRQPQTWREVGPFEWREVGGRERLDTKVENGRVVAWLPEDLSGFLIERVAPLESPRLNLSLLAVSAGVLIAATILWPVAATVRRRYGRSLALQGPAGRSYRLTRWAAACAALYLLSWALLLMAVASGAAYFDIALDPWIRLIQLIGVVCAAGAVVAVWNAWLTCTSGQSLWLAARSVVLALALLDIVWFSCVFHLISVHLNY